jgi:peroxiredoxin
MAVEVDQQAPDFDLAITLKERVTLSQFRGEKNVLLVFHPFAFTGICEAEGRELQDNLEDYRASNTEVIFVSCDSWAARQAWKEQLGADYTFASDFWPHGAAAKAYGVFNEDVGAAVRGTFLIDKNGIVLWTKVNPIPERREGLAAESLAAAVS